MNDWSNARFQKSSKSHIDGDECVEVASQGGLFGIRDSKNPDGPVLEFSRAQMSAFLSGTQNGHFDL